MDKVELFKCDVLVRYDDATLIAGLKRESARQRIHTARLIALMSEVDARGLYRECAYPSMFEYAVQALHMSEGEAYPRIAAGRLARKHPQVLEMLASGELHLTAIRLLCPVIDAENAGELLAAARHKSKRQMEHMLAQRAPKSDVKSSVRKLPASRAEGESGNESENVRNLTFEAAADPGDAAKRTSAPVASGPEQGRGSIPLACPAATGARQTAQHRMCSTGGAAETPTVPDAGVTASSSPLPPADVGSELLHGISRGSAEVPGGDIEHRSSAPCTPTPAVNARASEVPWTTGPALDPATSRPKALATPRSGRTDVSPLGGDRYRVQFTASQRMHDKLEQARHLLRHQIPSGDVAEICERALDLLIAQRMKECFAVGVKVRPRTKVGTGLQGKAPNRPVEDADRASGPAAAPPLSQEAKCDLPERTRESDAMVEVAAQQSDRPPPWNDLSPLRSRHIPHEVRRQVLARDGMRCTYFSADGPRCTARGALQFHHIHPYARGGEATLDNLTLRCAAHNALAAEQDYGKDFIRERVESPVNRLRDAALGVAGWGDGSAPAAAPHTSLDGSASMASMRRAGPSSRRY